jgi:hypothetical protein
MMRNPKGFGGGVFGLEALPEWMKMSLAMQDSKAN